MKQELDKCVLVIDEAMPRGLAANTAAILGITWGRLRPELVGEDVTDAAGAIHPGIIRTPVPVLSGRPETFQTLRRQLAELEFADVAAVDLTDLAQSCRTYGEFIEKMARTGPGELRYLGMGLMAPAGSTDPPQHHRHWCTNSCRQSRSLPRWHTTYYRIGSMRR